MQALCHFMAFWHFCQKANCFTKSAFFRLFHRIRLLDFPALVVTYYLNHNRPGAAPSPPPGLTPLTSLPPEKRGGEARCLKYSNLRKPYFFKVKSQSLELYYASKHLWDKQPSKGIRRGNMLLRMVNEKYEFETFSFVLKMGHGQMVPPEILRQFRPERSSEVGELPRHCAAGSMKRSIGIRPTLWLVSIRLMSRCMAKCTYVCE